MALLMYQPVIYVYNPHSGEANAHNRSRSYNKEIYILPIVNIEVLYFPILRYLRISISYQSIYEKKFWSKFQSSLFYPFDETT